MRWASDPRQRALLRAGCPTHGAPPLRERPYHRALMYRQGMRDRETAYGVARAGLFLVLAMFALASRAADVTMTEVKPPSSPSLIIRGEIVPGDYLKVLVEIARDAERGSPFLLRGRRVWLDSPGGNLQEAIKIGRLFRDIYVRGVAARRCASACFFMLAGAVERRFAGEVAIHNPYLPEGVAKSLDIQPLQQALREAEDQSRTALSDFGVPSDLADTMMSRTSAEAYLLTIDDMMRLGLSAPGWSQVRVSKCGARPDYERETFEKMLRTGRPPTSEEAAPWNQYLSSVGQCEDSLLVDVVRGAALRHMRSAQSGK